MIIQEENQLRLAAENSSTLNGTELKDKMTALDEIKAQQEQYETENKELEKQVGKWKKNNIVAIIVLIIVLLFSLTTVILQTKWKIKTYEVKLVANPIQVERVESKTSNEILAESQEMGYISNTMEFYYDASIGEVHRISDENTVYYDIDSAKAEIYGYPITYSIEEIVESNKPGQAQTEVATQEFSYGLLDGSAQEAIPNTNRLVFSGYTRSLIDSYMRKVEPITVTNDSAVIVVDKRFEVTEDFVDDLMKGVVEDYYMLNSDTVENLEDSDIQNLWYGLCNENDSIYYIASHGVNLKADKQQELYKKDVLSILENNIEEYLGEEVEVTTKVPMVSNKPLTVIYLTTNNYAYDYLYIINQLQLY